MTAIPFLIFVSVQRTLLDEKKSILPMSGVFRPQILSPKFSKTAIFDRRIRLVSSEGFLKTMSVP